MSLTTTLTLEEVAGKFASWRRTKKRGERIPHRLWQQVKKLSGHYRRGQITKTLQINIEQYRRYVHMDVEPKVKEVPRAKPPAPLPNTFVKIENNLPTQASVSLRLEFVRQDGIKLNCYYSSLEALHQTVEWFVR